MYQANRNHEKMTFRLKDGRDLGYAFFGNQDGYPLVYFHGFPGSRLEAKLLDDETRKTPYKIIAVDRPGIGLSSTQVNRELVDWPKDVVELANYLSLDEFVIIGVSGGGPYALACAYLIDPKRLPVVILISSMGPMISGKKFMPFPLRVGLTIAEKLPWLLKSFFILFVRPLHKTPRRTYYTIRSFLDSLQEVDKKIFVKNKRYMGYFIADNYWAYQRGIEGVVQDVEIYSKAWGFNLEDIPKELKIYLLHGKKDDIVPIEMGQYMAKKIPNCTARFYSNDAHFSTVANHLESLYEEIHDQISLKNV